MATFIDNAKPLGTLPFQTDWVTAVSFLGESRRLAAGNKRGDILIWDIPDAIDNNAPPAPIQRLDHHRNMITHLASTPDGRYLIASSLDHTVTIWDMREAKSTGKANYVTDSETRKQKSKKGDKKAVDAPGAEVDVFKPARVWSEHREWIQAMAISHDGKLLATGDDAGRVIVRELPTGKLIKEWTTKGWISALAIAPDNKTVCICERIPLDGERFRAAGVWDIEKGARTIDLMPAFEKKEHEFSAAAFSPDGLLLALGQGDDEIEQGKIHFLSPEDGKKLRESKAGHQYGARDVCFTQDSLHCLSCGRDTTIRIWDSQKGEQVKELGSPRGGQFKDWLHALALNEAQGLIAGADMAGSVPLWKYT